MQNSTKDLIQNLSTHISPVTKMINDFIPILASSLFILALGLISAFFFKWASKKILKWCMHLLPKKLREKDVFKDYFSFFVLGIGRLLFIITIFLTIGMVSRRLGLIILSEWLESLGRYMPSVFGCVLIIVIGWKLKDMTESILERGFSKKYKRYSTYSDLVAKLLSWSLFFISILFALQQIGINTELISTLSITFFSLISLGVISLISLGAKDTVSDIIYCHYLKRVLTVGATISLKDLTGTVSSIGPVFITIDTGEKTLTIAGKKLSHELIHVYKSDAF